MRNSRLLFLLLFLSMSWSLVHADEWHYSDVERIVAIGDVHGAYDALLETLQVAEVIDSELAWSGRKTHLVFTGDLLDRGAQSRRVTWLCGLKRRLAAAVAVYICYWEITRS